MGELEETEKLIPKSQDLQSKEQFITRLGELNDQLNSIIVPDDTAESSRSAFENLKKGILARIGEVIKLLGQIHPEISSAVEPVESGEE